MVRGELDWIVMKCLEKDRSRRYETANGLAMDVQRHLADEPVQACPPTAAYRLGKFARRNRRALAVAGLVLCVLVLAGVLAVGVPLNLALTEQRDLAVVNQERAARAEAETQQQLRRALAAERENEVRALLARATAYRHSGRPGQRFRCLAEIAEALKRDPPADLRAELRTEAVAALLLPDLEVDQEWAGTSPGEPCLTLDDRFEHSAAFDLNGNGVVHRLSDHTRLYALPGAGEVSGYGGIQFSPDGQFLLAMNGWKEIPVRLWRLRAPRPALVLEATAYHAAFRPDGREVAVVYRDGSIRIHDPESGRELRQFPSGLRDSTPASLAWNPRRPVLAALAGGVVRLLDTDDGRLVREIALAAGNGSLDWHPEGRLLAVADEPNIVVYDGQTGQLARPPLTGHRAQGVIIRFNRAGDRLLSNDWNGMWRLWDVRTGRQLLAHPALGSYLAFNHDDTRVAASVAPAPGRCQVFRFRSGREFYRFGRHDARAQVVGLAPPACLDGSGRLVAAWARDGVALLDVTRGEAVGHLPVPGTYPLGFEPGDAALLTYGAAGLLRWPVTPDPGAPGARRIGPPVLVHDSRMQEYWGSSPDRRVLAIPNYGGGALVYHRPPPAAPAGREESGRLVPLAGQEDVRFCAVSPDGRWVATGSHNVRVGPGAKVWNARTGELVAALPVGGQCGVGFTPDHHWLVTTSGGVRLWDVGTWRPGLKLSDIAGAFATTRDGRLMALEDVPGVVRLVVPDTGRELVRLSAPEQTRLRPLAFTPDGGRLVTWGIETEMIHVFDLRRVRAQLAGMGLDWDAPPLPAAPPDPVEPLRLSVTEQ
jgi:WD40 repeat protein